MPARGLCQYRRCGRPAAFHLLLSLDTVSWACSSHGAVAVEWWRPVDVHPMGALCALVHAFDPLLRWHFSSPQHEGFCYRVDPEWVALMEEATASV